MTLTCRSAWIGPASRLLTLLAGALEFGTMKSAIVIEKRDNIGRDGRTESLNIKKTQGGPH